MSGAPRQSRRLVARAVLLEVTVIHAADIEDRIMHRRLEHAIESALGLAGCSFEDLELRLDPPAAT